MRLAFATLLVGHGLLHLLGFAKALEFAELPQLTRPISPFMGVLWFAAAMLFLLTAGASFVWPRWWWAIGVLAIAFSMVTIVPSWADAKFGAVANLVALAGVVVGFLVDGPVSQRAGYEREGERLAPTAALDVLTDTDVAPLPAPVRGRPHRVSGNPSQHVRTIPEPARDALTFVRALALLDEGARLAHGPAQVFVTDDPGALERRACHGSHHHHPGADRSGCGVGPRTRLRL